MDLPVGPFDDIQNVAEIARLAKSLWATLGANDSGGNAPARTEPNLAVPTIQRLPACFDPVFLDGLWAQAPAHPTDHI